MGGESLIQLDTHCLIWMDQADKQMGRSARVPWPMLPTRLEGFHADPADRFIIATAQALGATLVTAEQLILAWTGRLERHDARL